MTSLLVYKSRRRLELIQAGRLIQAWSLGLGREPLGPKEREGDGRTPEGEYYICTRNPDSKYHLALGLSYPNAADVRRGLALGLIDQAQARLILAALAGGKRPPWDTALGGEIMLHGGGATDWTAGCIALEDGAMDRLWPLCPLGTQVIIRP